MKPIQQRRLFFLTTATSNTKKLEKVGPSWNERFRPCGWIAAILSAALLFGCSSLTPDRVNVIAAIAGQAAQVGAADWLAKHPNHKASFDAVIAALVALQKAGNTNEDAFVELMSSLPVDALRGPAGELYVAGDGGLVVWDATLKKAVGVRGKATAPVMRATLIGMKRAMVPKPPAPVVARARRVEDLEGRVEEAPVSLIYRGRTNLFIGLNQGLQPTNALYINPLTLTNVQSALTLHFNSLTLTNVHSTFDVTLNEYGIQQVNVRWVMEPNAHYIVQRKENKEWEGYSYAQNTNKVATPWVWTTLWPAQAEVGLWRAVRR